MRKKNLLRHFKRHFKPASPTLASALTCGHVGRIEEVRFVDRDTLILKYGDKRQRRRVRRKEKRREGDKVR